MNVLRLLRHLATTRWSTRRRFDPAARAAIEGAIGECEQRHGGELRFIVETALDLPQLWHDLTPRTRALQVFGQFGVWNTEHNHGVLIYVLLADRAVEIIADRGIARHVTPAEWQAVCRQMEQHFRAGDYAQGATLGILGVAALLGRHFPAGRTGGNELPDQPVLL